MKLECGVELRQETRRRENNRDKILVFLQHRGPAGATNMELFHVGGLRYGARLFELRNLGYLIDTVAVQGGNFRFILRGRVKAEQQNLFAEANQ